MGVNGSKHLTGLVGLSVVSLITSVLGASVLGATALWTSEGAVAQTVAATKQENVPNAVREAYTLLGQGLVNDAIAAFEAALRRYPDSLEGKLGLAIAYRRAGRDGEAWTTYQRVLAQDPSNILALRSVGILGTYRPEWQPKGIEALTALLKQTPNDPEALAQRALLYGYQNRFAEALADYQIVLQRNPSPGVILDAAQIYAYAENYVQSLELFDRYRQQQRTIPDAAAIAYARALRGTGNPALAIQTLQALLPRAVNDQALQIRSELAQAYLDNQQPTEALAVLDPLRGRPEARLPLARALNEIGQRQSLPILLMESASLYKQVLAESPNPSPSLVQEIADVLSGIAPERPFALQLVRQLAAQNPGDRPLALQQLGLESQLGMVGKAEVRQRLRTLMTNLPADPVQLTVLGQALGRIEPDAEFFPLYQSLLQGGANAPFLHFRSAQLLIERGDFGAARNALAVYQGTPEGGRDLSPQLLLADIERREGNPEGAAQRLIAVLNQPSATTELQEGALRSLAGIRLSQNRAGEALAYYDQLVARNPQNPQIQLGRTSVAYQAGLLSPVQAEAAIAYWFQTRTTGEFPPELYSLVGALPPAPQREALYVTLLEADPNSLPIQVRYIQVVAQRNPLQARARVNQLLARLGSAATPGSSEVGLAFLKGQLEQALGNLDEAGAVYERLLAYQPDNADALSALGGIRFQQRRFDTAQRLYTQVLSLRPEDRGAQRSLIELTAAQGKPLEALQQMEQLQLQQAGTVDAELLKRQQQIQEDLLKQRGFQPPWERY